MFIFYEDEVLITTFSAISPVSFFRDIVVLYPTSNELEIPDVRELETDPLQVVDLIINLCHDSQTPIRSHMMCLRVIRAADFLGADPVLNILVERLGCHRGFASSLTPVAKLRSFIRDRYRKTQHHRSKVPGGGLCSVSM